MTHWRGSTSASRCSSIFQSGPRQALRYYVERKFDKAAAVFREALREAEVFGVLGKPSDGPSLWSLR